MSKQELFERILMSLHAAVLDDSEWSRTSRLIDEFCESEGNFLVFCDGDSPERIDVFFSRLCYRGQRDAELEREYFEVYHPVDERIPRIRQLPDSQIVSVRSLFTEEEIKHSRVYNESLSRSKAGDSLTVRLDGPRGSRIVWSIGDPVGGDGWSSARVETIGRLLPNVRQFLRLRQTLVDAGVLRTSVTGLLDNDRTGVIQLNRRGRLMEANDHARALLREPEGLSDRQGLLYATAPAEDAELGGLLTRALPFLGGPGTGGSMTVSRANSLPKLVLHVNPAIEDGADPRRSRIGALVLVIDPTNRTGIERDRVGAILGLTAAESFVAVSLARGKTIREIAAITGRSPATIRWHLRHIFAKHGLSRQVELVQLVTSLVDFRGGRR